MEVWDEYDSVVREETATAGNGDDDDDDDYAMAEAGSTQQEDVMTLVDGNCRTNVPDEYLYEMPKQRRKENWICIKLISPDRIEPGRKYTVAESIGAYCTVCCREVPWNISNPSNVKRHMEKIHMDLIIQYEKEQERIENISCGLPSSNSKKKQKQSAGTSVRHITSQSYVNDSSSSYTYSPKELVASYERLKVNIDNLWPINSDETSLSTTTTIASTCCRSNREVTIAAVQITGTGLSQSDVTGWCQRAEHAIEIAAKRGSQLVVLPELWSMPYFCQTIHNDLFTLADPVFLDNNDTSTTTTVNHVLVQRMQLLAKKFHVVLPVSIYERKNTVYYNSVVMIDSDGSVLGVYRKTHIPDAIGYYEKFYFTPGDTGFKVFTTSVGKVGVGICWDQWFPEVARSLVLLGAEILVYPTAIGTEPEMPDWDTSDHWQRVMQGHAAANFVPVIASNRFGPEIVVRDTSTTDHISSTVNGDDATDEQKQEVGGDAGVVEVSRMRFYGRSFITDETGQKNCRSY